MSARTYFTKTVPVTFMYVACLIGLSGYFANASDYNPLKKAFSESFSNPGDIDAALAYAEEAVKQGDYAAAIPPLERILMFNPTLSDVRVEVGVLYYLLDSRDMARQHLRIVAHDNRTADATKARANTYLEKL